MNCPLCNEEMRVGFGQHLYCGKPSDIAHLEYDPINDTYYVISVPYSVVKYTDEQMQRLVRLKAFL